MDANFLFEYFCNPINQPALKNQDSKGAGGRKLDEDYGSSANLTFAFSWHLNKVLNFPPLSSQLFLMLLSLA